MSEEPPVDMLNTREFCRVASNVITSEKEGKSFAIVNDLSGLGDEDPIRPWMAFPDTERGQLFAAFMAMIFNSAYMLGRMDEKHGKMMFYDRNAINEIMQKAKMVYESGDS